jgi:site-specific DNA-methyltransferase (adenine-specific)
MSEDRVEYGDQVIENTALVEINQAELALQRADDIGEIMELRDKSAAFQLFANAQGFKEAAQKAKIFQLKAERKAGGWLDENVDHRGAVAGNDLQDVSRLPDGISYQESHRWQKEAELPEEKFNEWVDESLANGWEISAAGLRNEATKYKTDIRRQELINKRGNIALTEQGITLVHGDMLTVIPTLGNFDLILTDPPYGVTDYSWDVLNTKNWLEAIKPHLNKEYNLFWFCSPRYATDIEFIFRELEFPIQSRIVWHRRNMALGSAARNKFVDTWEMIFHAGNRELNFPSEWSSAWFDVQEFAVPQTNFTDTKLHPTQKPADLIRRLVEFGSYPGDKILDPFAGSGTTGSVCPNDRQCTLIEKEEEYVGIAENRLGIKRV